MHSEALRIIERACKVRMYTDSPSTAVGNLENIANRCDSRTQDYLPSSKRLHPQRVQQSDVSTTRISGQRIAPAAPSPSLVFMLWASLPSGTQTSTRSLWRMHWHASWQSPQCRSSTSMDSKNDVSRMTSAVRGRSRAQQLKATTGLKLGDGD